MNAFLGSRRLWKVLHSSLRFSRAFWKIAVTTMCGGVHQMFCCALTTNHSLKPPGSVLLVNTTPSNSWSWLLSSGNGFVLVVSWQSAGDLSTEGGAGNHLAWGGGTRGGRGGGVGGWWWWKGAGEHFPLTGWKCFVNVTVCCCCRCLWAGWFIGESCVSGQKPQPPSHMLLHTQREMKRYRTGWFVCRILSEATAVLRFNKLFLLCFPSLNFTSKIHYRSTRFISASVAENTLSRIESLEVNTLFLTYAASWSCGIASDWTMCHGFPSKAV